MTDLNIGILDLFLFYINVMQYYYGINKLALLFCGSKQGEKMGDKSKDIRRHLTVIQGGKKDTVIQAGKKDYAAAPQLCSEFDMHGFLSQGETVDTTQLQVPPKYYGKAINGMQYGDPAKQPVLLYVDKNNKPVFDY